SANLRIDAPTGELLRKQRAKLPTTRSLQIKLKENIKRTTEAQMRLLEHNERLDKLPDEPEAQARALFAKINSPEISQFEIAELLKSRRELLQKVSADYRSEAEAFQELNQSTRQALLEIQSYSQLLDERLLWIPSAGRVSRQDLIVESSGLWQLASPVTLWSWGHALWRDFLAQPLLWLLALVVLSLLLYRRRRARKLLELTATQSRDRNCLSFLPTAICLWSSFVLTLLIPFCLLFIAWRSSAHPAFQQGLMATGIYVFLVGGLRNLAHKNGLLIAHFRFDAERCGTLHRQLTWFLYLMSPLIFLSFALPAGSQAPEAGRLSFMASMVVLATFNHSVFRPSRSPLTSIVNSTWLPKLVHLLVLLIPISFIIAASQGYLSSSLILREKLAITIWFLLILSLITRLLIRWILISRRRLAKEQARRKYEALVASNQELPEGEKSETPTLEELEANAIDPTLVETQTRRIVRVCAFVCLIFGLWGIWSTTLPALAVLDKVTLWGGGSESTPAATTPALIPGSLTGSEASAPEESEPHLLAAKEADSSGISLQDLLVALVILTLTVIASKNIPGLLELILLSRLQLAPGGNYAITTVLRYLIILFGLVLAFGKIGITWSSVQWLAAAVTLGIGFGLQEIFANFVAGIILLFERPIRLGDIVTVGDVTGQVTQIQIRATTIKQFNNRELLIPNKEFITGQLVNWTLSDRILRFEILLGVAYGSDTQKASDLLSEIISGHPKVLANPAPHVVFTSFGASTLDFTIRGYVAGPEDLLHTQSELHHEINRRFNEAGIEIAFPQTDIHIRSLPENYEQALFKTAAQALTESESDTERPPAT
ncbi:MAG: mechanosensitive ion channel domain-containing protein, partial [Verrucomicrobiales bacterium]